MNPQTWRTQCRSPTSNSWTLATRLPPTLGTGRTWTLFRVEGNPRVSLISLCKEMAGFGATLSLERVAGEGAGIFGSIFRLCRPAQAARAGQPH